MSTLDGTNAAVPRLISTVETRAKTNVALKPLRANFSVGSRRNQATKRGENWLEPYWITSRTTAVTNPVKASMPLLSADSAAMALDALMDLSSLMGSARSQRTRPALKKDR